MSAYGSVCRMRVCLIDVPFAMGDDRHDAHEGGRRLIEGGGRELFDRRGIACRVVFFPGMALAIVTGHCYAAWWAQIGDAAPVPEEHVALLGVRDLSPAAERERLDRSRMLRVAWADGRPDGDVDATVATLAARVEDVYLHVELDALDPSIAPGIVDAPVPHGLSLPQLDALLGAITRTLGVRAVALTTYTPSRDVDGATHATALHVLGHLAEHCEARAVNQGRRLL